MRIAYTLEEADLEKVIIQLTLWQRARVWARLERLRTGPVWCHLGFNALIGIAMGALVLPLWIAFIHEVSVALYPCLVALPVVIVTAIQRFKAPRRRHFSGVYRWVLRWQLRRSRARSVLGPIEIALGDGGLARKNQIGETNIP
jgi:hypothetical protein